MILEISGSGIELSSRLLYVYVQWGTVLIALAIYAGVRVFKSRIKGVWL